MNNGLANSNDLGRRLLDVLDIAIVALSADGSSVLLANRHAKRLLGEDASQWTPTVAQAALSFAGLAAGDRTREPLPIKVFIRGRFFYVRVIRTRGAPDFDAIIMREDVL